MNLDKKIASWLQDIHAIEQHAEISLGKYSHAAKNYPALSAKLAEHVSLARRHKEQLEACLKSFGKHPSGFESVVASILGAGQTAASAMLGDSILTNAAAAYAVEQLEVATLTAIIAAAEVAGRTECAETCRSIMEEDKAMAVWLLGQIPQLTRQYLGQLEKGN